MSQDTPEPSRPTLPEETAIVVNPPALPKSPEPSDTPATLPADYLARPMFWLGFLYLLVVAGLLHRFGQPEVTQLEREILLVSVLFIYPFFVAEGLLRILTPRRWIPRRRELGRFLLILLFPPLRMGNFSQTRRNQLWLPFLGWRNVDNRLVRQIDKIFSVPMIFFAALLLPILIIEYTKQDLVRAEPMLALGLQIGIAVIWTAFAFEFVVKISIAPKTLVFLRDRWIDVAIVVLPLFEFILTHWVDAAPLARLLRLSRAISPEQVAQLARLYRLRGLLMRAWHAFMILEVVSRILGNSEERRIAKLRAQIEEKNREIADLEEQIGELRMRIEQRAQRQAERQRKLAERRQRRAEPNSSVSQATAEPALSPTSDTNGSTLLTDSTGQAVTPAKSPSSPRQD